jgi:hypothetical protein
VEMLNVTQRGGPDTRRSHPPVRRPRQCERRRRNRRAARTQAVMAYPPGEVTVGRDRIRALWEKILADAPLRGRAVATGACQRRGRAHLHDRPRRRRRARGSRDGRRMAPGSAAPPAGERRMPVNGAEWPAWSRVPPRRFARPHVSVRTHRPGVVSTAVVTINRSSAPRPSRARFKLHHGPLEYPGS